METYMISVQTDESFDELEEKEIQWHISSPENSMKERDDESYFEQELKNQFENHLLITVGYQYSKDEMTEIYKKNIKVKQVITNQLITKGGSKCTDFCDIENHHIHMYCKVCKRNL